MRIRYFGSIAAFAALAGCTPRSRQMTASGSASERDCFNVQEISGYGNAGHNSIDVTAGSTGNTGSSFKGRGATRLSGPTASPLNPPPRRGSAPAAQPTRAMSTSTTSPPIGMSNASSTM